ncbi:MAG TPA: hypothetical protein VE782_08895, partial [Myxococcaceae bacterium]|nr:hypothetical protein [Myxococcaceae bacterium]
MGKLFRLSIAVGFAILAAAACDLHQLTAEKTMVASLLATPAISISPSAMAGADAGFDPGALDGGQMTIPAQTAAFVFFGDRSNTSLDTPPSPVPGAAVSVRENGGTGVALEDTGEGTYALSSNQNPALEYTSGATYDFEAVLQGQTYVGRVENAPDLERVDALHPQAGFIQHP